MTTVDYVDCHMNFYDPERDTVVLDKKLGCKELVLARTYILVHELEHAMIDDGPDGAIKSWVRQVWHEFQADVFLFFSMSPTAKQVRQYESMCKQTPGAGVAVGNLLRTTWQIPMLLLTYPVRSLLKRARGAPTND